MEDFNNAPDAYFALTPEQQRWIEVRPGTPLDLRCRETHGDVSSRLSLMGLHAFRYSGNRLFYVNEAARKAFCEASDLFDAIDAGNVALAHETLAATIRAIAAANEVFGPVPADDACKEVVEPAERTRGFIAALFAAVEPLGMAPNASALLGQRESLAVVVAEADRAIKVPKSPRRLSNELRKSIAMPTITSAGGNRSPATTAGQKVHVEPNQVADFTMRLEIALNSLAPTDDAGNNSMSWDIAREYLSDLRHLFNGARPTDLFTTDVGAIDAIREIARRADELWSETPRLESAERVPFDVKRLRGLTFNLIAVARGLQQRRAFETVLPAVNNDKAANEKPKEQTKPTAEEASKPKWNTSKRELWFNGTLIKKFKQPAPNQQAIIETFECEGWPDKIDDPLPYSGKNAPVKLYQTLKDLNDSIVGFRFEVNGTGKEILWSSPEAPR